MATITWTWHGWNDEIVPDPGNACYASIYSDSNLLDRVAWIEDSRWYRTGAERVPGSIILTDGGSMEWRRNDGQLTDQPNQIETVHVVYQITGGEWSIRLRIYPWADLDSLKVVT